MSQETRPGEPSKTAVAGPPRTPWPPSVLELLEDWSARADASSAAHYHIAARLGQFNLALGIPVVALTTVVGTSVFASIGNSVNTAMRVVVGAISVTAAVLASLQTFLRFAERGEKHRAAAEKWASIRREIVEVLALHPEHLGTQSDSRKYLDDLRKRMDRIAAESPEMGESTWTRARKGHFGVERGPDASAAPGAGDGTPPSSGVTSRRDALT